jgi:ABC-type phosphate/phosphonate transport system ATPase subunit
MIDGRFGEIGELFFEIDLVAVYGLSGIGKSAIALKLIEQTQTAADKNDIYLGNLEPILESHLERLSESEKKVGYWVSNSR